MEHTNSHTCFEEIHMLLRIVLIKVCETKKCTHTRKRCSHVFIHDVICSVYTRTKNVQLLENVQLCSKNSCREVDYLKDNSTYPYPHPPCNFQDSSEGGMGEKAISCTAWG